jgi:tripartite-type tricarboxylate transporter receptor subunit TctC
MKRVLMLLLTASGLSTIAAQGLAQTAANYPEKPVRVIISWAAGGNADVLGRILTQRLSDAVGQQFVVENRGGANGTIGSAYVVRSRPDGYTVLIDGVQTHAINGHVMSGLPYVTQRDLAPVALLGSVLHILVAHPSLPARNTKELIALARARPMDVVYASFGEWTTTHLAGEFFQQVTNTRMLHVTSDLLT